MTNPPSPPPLPDVLHGFANAHSFASMPQTIEQGSYLPVYGFRRYPEEMELRIVPWPPSPEMIERAARRYHAMLGRTPHDWESLDEGHRNYFLDRATRWLRAALSGAGAGETGETTP